MTHAGDVEELRRLQAKAYGREGERLSADEAARLHELERDRVRSTALPPVVPSAPESIAATEAVGAAVPAARVEHGPHGESARTSDPAAGEHADPAGVVPAGASVVSTPMPLRALVRGHAKTLAAASFVLVLLGLAVGWAVFGRDDGAPALTAGQQERRIELQSGDEYDQGSVRLIAEDDDAVVWYATRGGGEVGCAVLDVGDASQEQCGGGGDDPLSVSVSVPVADPDDPAEEYGISISATVGFTPSGEPLAWIHRWDMSDAMLEQFEGLERERAEALIADGYTPGLSIVGYFHDEPVWLAERPADGTQSGGFVRCMVVDAASEATSCAPADEEVSDLRALSLETADDGTTVLWTVQIRFTGWGSPYLTIEQGDPADVGVSYVELGGEHGDPILVEVPTSETGG